MSHGKFVVIDGDGAVLMNLNGPVTLGWQLPKNLIHLVFDNKVYEASSGTPTASAVNANLRDLALGAGIQSAHQVEDLDGFEKILAQSLASEGPQFIVALVELSKERPAHPRIDEMENRYRFIRYLEGLKGRHLLKYPADLKVKPS